MKSLKRPYVLYVAEKIYFQIVQLKKQNPKFSKKDCIKNFIGSELYNKISTGEFHDDWFVDLKQNNFIDLTTQKKIPTILASSQMSKKSSRFWRGLGKNLAYKIFKDVDLVLAVDPQQAELFKNSHDG